MCEVFLRGDYDPRLNQADSIEGDVENVIGTAQNDLLTRKRRGKHPRGR